MENLINILELEKNFKDRGLQYSRKRNFYFDGYMPTHSIDYIFNDEDLLLKLDKIKEMGPYENYPINENANCEKAYVFSKNLKYGVGLDKAIPEIIALVNKVELISNLSNNFFYFRKETKDIGSTFLAITTISNSLRDYKNRLPFFKEIFFTNIGKA